MYDDDGREHALKLFIDDDDDEVDSDGEEIEPDGALDIGALREISALRLFRCDNGHPNVVAIADVKTLEGDGDDEDELDVGAGTGGCVGVAMPLFRDGTLTSAIDSGALRSDRAGKVAVAHGLLSAVAYLHGNGVMHRDIKGDNVMMVRNDDDDAAPSSSSSQQQRLRPVLIDFSLAKLFDASLLGRSEMAFGLDDGTTHTPECGTPTYRAPEVVSSAGGDERYGPPADLWSVGVCLLEIIQGGTLRAEKDKEAARLVEEAKAALPDQPFPNLVRKLLEIDPEKRPTAREALDCPLFEKFGMVVDERTLRRVEMDRALPFEEEDEEDGYGENDSRLNGPTMNGKGESKRRKGGKVDPATARRMKTLQRLCSRLDCAHPLTRQAALCYSRQMEQLEDTLDDVTESQALMDCAVLAARFFERDLPNLHELDECDKGEFARWSLEEYQDNESTLWMMMDFCLYPRKLVEWAS